VKPPAKSCLTDPKDLEIFKKIGARLYQVAQRRAKAAGVSTDVYFRGIINGKYPPLNMIDLYTSGPAES
jgi:hypothetical protein